MKTIELEISSVCNINEPSSPFHVDLYVNETNEMPSSLNTCCVMTGLVVENDIQSQFFEGFCTQPLVGCSLWSM